MANEPEEVEKNCPQVARRVSIPSFVSVDDSVKVSNPNLWFGYHDDMSQETMDGSRSYRIANPRTEGQVDGRVGVCRFKE